MKVSVAMLLLCSAVLTTEARHARRQYYGSPQDEGLSNNIVQCQNKILLCAFPLMQYESPDPVQTTQRLKTAGAQQVCNDVKLVTECASEAIKQSVCSNYPKQSITMFNKGISLSNTLCVNRIADLKKHWNCLLGSQTYDTMSQCDREAEQLVTCNTAPLTNCVANLFKNRAGCDSGADDFVRKIFPDIISVGLGAVCPDRTNLAQSLFEFMKLK